MSQDDISLEVHEWEPYLQETLLPSIADHLVELTLSGPFFWGAIPAEFNGKGQNFPRLTSLTLCECVIIREDQFDWVLAQESLTSLRMHSAAR